MLTEVSPTQWTIVVAGNRLAGQCFPSRQLAEIYIMTLPADQRQVAEAVPMTNDGRMILLG